MSSAFEQELKAVWLGNAKRRNASPRIKALKAGTLDEQAIKLQVVQWYFHTVGFVSALRHLYDRCDIPKLRSELAESLYEEETGKITGTAPHLDLYFQAAAGFGLTRKKIETEAYILPEMAAVVNWYHYACAVLDPLEGLAVLCLFAEGNNAEIGGYPGSSRIFADALCKHYGKSADDVLFYEVHDIADRDHAEVGIRNLAKLANTPVKRERVLTAIYLSQGCYGELNRLFQRDYAEAWSPQASAVLYPH